MTAALAFIQRWAVVALIVAALLACLKLAQLESALVEAKLDAANYKLEVSTAQRAADVRVRRAEQTIATNYQGALNAAREREALLRRELDGLRHVSDGLREQAADAARRLAAAAPAAVLEYATAVNTLFDDCRAAYADVAEKAEGHAADVRLMQDAWPRTKPATVQAPQPNQ